MNLSKKDKQELRKSVEVLLNASPDNKKIQLSNETLNELLFDTYIVNKEKGIKVKLPVWSGDFLRKLDLSRVSFENVSWLILGLLADDFTLYDYTDFYGELFDKNTLDELSKLKVSIIDDTDQYCVSYANTNAKIDFDSSFEVKYFDGYLGLYHCNFSNLDLSNNQLFEKANQSRGSWILENNFSNSNIKTNIINQWYTIGSRLEDVLTGSNFENVDLSGMRKLDGSEFIESRIPICSLKNTGAHITVDKKSLKEIEKYYSEDKEKKNIKNFFEKVCVGCYVNGVLIKSPDEKKASKKAIRQAYDEYKNQEVASILNSIASQIESSGPKK